MVEKLRNTVHGYQWDSPEVCSLSVGFQIIKITSKHIQSNYKRVHCHIHSSPPSLGQRETNDDDDDDYNDADDDDGNDDGNGGGDDDDDDDDDTEEEEDLCLLIP